MMPQNTGNRHKKKTTVFGFANKVRETRIEVLIIRRGRSEVFIEIAFSFTISPRTGEPWSQFGTSLNLLVLHPTNTNNISRSKVYICLYIWSLFNHSLLLNDRLSGFDVRVNLPTSQCYYPSPSLTIVVDLTCHEDDILNMCCWVAQKYFFKYCNGLKKSSEQCNLYKSTLHST